MKYKIAAVYRTVGQYFPKEWIEADTPEAAVSILCSRMLGRWITSRNDIKEWILFPETDPYATQYAKPIHLKEENLSVVEIEQELKSLGTRK